MNHNILITNKLDSGISASLQIIRIGFKPINFDPIFMFSKGIFNLHLINKYSSLSVRYLFEEKTFSRLFYLYGKGRIFIDLTEDGVWLDSEAMYSHRE